MFAYGSGDSCMQIKKFKDALAKHKPDRCSIGPTKGLEEQELFALAANKDLQLPTPWSQNWLQAWKMQRSLSLLSVQHQQSRWSGKGLTTGPWSQREDDM